MDRVLTNLDLKRDEFEVSLYLNTSKQESFWFKVGIENYKIVEHSKDSVTFRT